jgi:hypothetical protein
LLLYKKHLTLRGEYTIKHYGLVIYGKQKNSKVS